jgi:hypothetical protein
VRIIVAKEQCVEDVIHDIAILRLLCVVDLETSRHMSIIGSIALGSDPSFVRLLNKPQPSLFVAARDGGCGQLLVTPSTYML